MTKPVTGQVTFQGQTPPWQLTQLDANTTTLFNAINDWGTYSVYVVDSGSVNTLAVTLAAGLTVAYIDGLTFDINVANTTTSTTPTFNVNSLGAKTITDYAGNALAVGALIAGQRYRLMYDGTNFRVWNPAIAPVMTVDAVSGVNTTGYFNANSTGITQALFNSAGAAWGTIQNDAGGIWSLGFTTTLTNALGIPILQWSSTPSLAGRGPTATALVDMTPDKGSFTMTYTGFTTTVTGTAFWARNGNLCILYFPSGTGTAAGGVQTFTGGTLPAAITPVRAQMVQVPDNCAENNSSLQGNGVSASIGTGSNVTFYTGGSSTGWSSSGTKGIVTGFTVSYLLS